jgi:hypothetical protein
MKYIIHIQQRLAYQTVHEIANHKQTNLNNPSYPEGILAVLRHNSQIDATPELMNRVPWCYLLLPHWRCLALHVEQNLCLEHY